MVGPYCNIIKGNKHHPENIKGGIIVLQINNFIAFKNKQTI